MGIQSAECVTWEILTVSLDWTLETKTPTLRVSREDPKVAPRRKDPRTGFGGVDSASRCVRERRLNAIVFVSLFGGFSSAVGFSARPSHTGRGVFDAGRVWDGGGSVVDGSSSSSSGFSSCSGGGDSGTSSSRRIPIAVSESRKRSTPVSSTRTPKLT